MVQGIQQQRGPEAVAAAAAAVTNAGDWHNPRNVGPMHNLDFGQPGVKVTSQPLQGHELFWKENKITI